MLGLTLVSAVVSSCTFYTSCPDPNKPPNTGAGGTNDTGGAPPVEGGGPAMPVLVPWTNVTSNLGEETGTSTCGRVTLVHAKSDLVVAGLSESGLWGSTDNGESWQLLGQGDGSDVLSGLPRSITTDPDNPSTFWLATIYGDNGVWRTDDNGDTFHVQGTVRHNDLISLDFADPDRKIMLAGGHEARKTLWRSPDAGQTWVDVGMNLPDDSRASSYPLVLGPELHLLGAAGYGEGISGIFRTEDGGASWERVSKSGGFGKPLVAADGAVLWPSDDGSLVRSADAGQTWEEVLPRDTLVGYQALLQLPDERLAILTHYEGVKIVSADFSELVQVTERVPFETNGFTYSEATRSFFTWSRDCTNNEPDDAIMRADFDYEALADGAGGDAAGGKPSE
ncbi:MAG TPA: hypothetical protein VHP33_26410 [Polyangiaceae bacterium]|nr:hypothetical protein [Polyangiaceae bacterium]